MGNEGKYELAQTILSTLQQEHSFILKSKKDLESKTQILMAFTGALLLFF